jgi:hypothetical protein
LLPGKGGDEDGWSLGYRDEVRQQSPCLSEVWFWWLVLGSKQLNMLNCGLWFQNIEPNVAHLEWSRAAQNPRLVSQPFGKNFNTPASILVPLQCHKYTAQLR